MRSSDTAPIDRVLEARAARQRLVVTLGCLAAAGSDLVLIAGFLRGFACFVGASLLATAGLRFAPGLRRIVTPFGQVAAVFLSTSAPLLVAPVWVAAIDPESGLSAMPWRHVLVLAVVWPAIGSAIAAQWLGIERDRCALEERARISDGGVARSSETVPSAPGAAIGVVVGGLLVWLGEGIFLASMPGFGAARIALTALLYGAVCLGVAALTGRWIHRLLGVATERARLDAVAAVDRFDRDAARALEPLESRLEAIAPISTALEQERDRLARDQSHAIEAARALWPAPSAGDDGAGELAERIERCHRHVEALRAAGQGSADREQGLAHRVEAAARGLVTIDQASRAMSSRMLRIAGASRDSTTSLAELVDAMRSVDGAADSIEELSSSLVARAEQGRARFAETVTGMEAIRTATEAAESIIRGLDARTREIGGILDVIDEVGDQTSLLALNAAIIAAQAGEHGRAFSVVAEEIRDLADRVLVSTKEIGGLIQSVQTESERAIGAIETGARSVRDGESLAAEVGRTLEEITRASHATRTQIATVVRAVERQSGILDRAVELASRVEESVLEIESADVDRTRNHAVVAETMLGLRDAATGLRSLVLEQAAGLARIDGELGGALDSARGLVAVLEGRANAGQGVVRLIETGGERVRSIGSIGAELVAAHEAIRFASIALRARSTRMDVQSTRSGVPARAMGEGS